MSDKEVVHSHDFSSVPTAPLYYSGGTSNTPSGPVALNPWHHQSMPIILIVLVMLVEAGTIAAGAYLILHPIKRPLASNIATGLSVRSYLVVINVATNVMGFLAAMCVAYGARSHLARKLVRGGVNLTEYQR